MARPDDVSNVAWLWFFLSQQRGHQVVVETRQRFQHGCSRTLGGLTELVRNRFAHDARDVFFVSATDVVDRLHVDQIDDSAEVTCASSIGICRAMAFAFRLVVEFADNAIRVGSGDDPSC